MVLLFLGTRLRKTFPSGKVNFPCHSGCYLNLNTDPVRNHLLVQTLSGLIFIKVDGPKPEDYKPDYYVQLGLPPVPDFPDRDSSSCLPVSRKSVPGRQLSRNLHSTNYINTQTHHKYTIPRRPRTSLCFNSFRTLQIE